MQVVFALELYSPQKQGEEGCRALLDQVVGAVLTGRPGGLRVERWTMGETGFQAERGMFRGRVQLQCRGLLAEAEREDGAFLGFTVKGGVTIDRNHES